MSESALPDAPEAVAPRQETPFARFVSEYAESPVAVVSLIAVVLIVAVALFAPWLSPQNPYDLAQLDIMDGRQPAELAVHVLREGFPMEWGEQCTRLF